MPQPRRKRSHAPNETRNQNGNYNVATTIVSDPSIHFEGGRGGGGAAYQGNNVLLHDGREGDEFKG